MSVVNQVLNQLEQRGVHTAPDQAMVRAVPRGKRRLVMPLLAVGLVLAAGVVTWQWIQIRKSKMVAVNVVQQQPVAAMPVPASAVRLPAAASAVVAEETRLAAAVLPPASHLSFELGSIPSSSTLRPSDAAQGRPRPRQTLRTAPEEACPEPCRRDAGHPASTSLPAQPAKPQPLQITLPNARAADQPSADVPPMKQVSPAQQADAEFRKAVTSMQQGHIADAITGYEAVLRLDADHDAARQALVALLLESKRAADAARVLQEGLKNKPEHTGFAMLLARLQVEGGSVEQAVATLEKSLPYAEAQAAYQAFIAALLQRQGRHKEAADHYQIALRPAPNNGVWLMGYGISLQALQRTDDARDAFRRALESKTLNPELQAFVQQKLKEL